MFILNSWPKSRKPKRKGGRPKTKAVNTSREVEKAQIDILLGLSILSEQQYQTALWYQKCWHRYKAAIDSPKLQKVYYEKYGAGDAWSDNYIESIELRWNKVQGIIKYCGKEARAILDQVVCFDVPCSNVALFKIILDELEKGMSK